MMILYETEQPCWEQEDVHAVLVDLKKVISTAERMWWTLTHHSCMHLPEEAVVTNTRLS